MIIIVFNYFAVSCIENGVEQKNTENVIIIKFRFQHIHNKQWVTMATMYYVACIWVEDQLLSYPVIYSH